MNKIILLAAVSACLVACDARINTAPSEKAPEKVIEKNTTIVTPPAKEEEKKTTTTTTEIKK